MIGSNLWSALWGSWRRAKIKLTEPDKWREVMGDSFSQEVAMRLSTVWACVNRNSTTAGTFPCQVHKAGARGAEWTQRFPDHPLYRILRHRPNADFTASRFWESTFAALDLWGNGFHEKLRGSGNKVVGLGWLGPEAMSDRVGEDGRIVYLYRDPVLRRMREIPEDEVIHYRRHSFGERYGVSAIRHGARSMKLATAAEDAAASTFANGMRPGGYLTTNGRSLTEPQREQAQKTLIDDMRGPDNAGKWKILEFGFDVKTIAINPEDAEMLASRKFGVEEICRWFDVPPILVGHAAEGQTMWGSGVEQILIAWLTLGLRPRYTGVEDQLEAGLLTAAEQQDGVTIKFNPDALLRADSAARATFLGTMVDKGIYSRNEARSKENLPPKDGADELTVQQQMVPISQIGKIQRPALQPPPAA